MSWYLSPINSVSSKDVFGLFETLGRQHKDSVIEQFLVWVLDNGCFSDRWSEDAWLRMLGSHGDALKATCLFCVVPDVLVDYEATLERFETYAPMVRSAGYPLAFVTQDGQPVDRVPWSEIDALFIGGTDQHKRGREGARLIEEGLKRGKWVHVGRVNSAWSIEHLFWRADSWDGTTLCFEPNQADRLAAAVRRVRAKKERQLCLF
jgi:hypothetical protein